MSEQQAQMPGQAAERRFKERVTALIGLGIGVIYSAVALIAAYTAISGSTSSENFQQLKDILNFMSGLMGTVVGYYFGRVGVENRAEAAESTMQTAQTMWTEAERQAAHAVARLDVEAMAREASEKGKEFAEQAQVKAEQVAQVAQVARQEAETRLDQMGEVMADVTQNVQSVRERIATFRDEASGVAQAAAEMFRSLGPENADAAAPAVNVQELDAMVADLDALLSQVERVRH